MALTVRYVSRLEDVVAPAVEHLGRRVDLFARQQIVVPTAGAKAWLLSELAKRLGATGSDDGIVANVDISYPDAIARLLQPERGRKSDPWTIDHLTFHVLDELAAGGMCGPLADRAGEPLLAARALATRFDHYHVRRPAMIREWDKGIAVLSPTASDVIRDGEREMTALADSDRWQFDLWRAVRKRIGKPSPPARKRAPDEPAPESLLVAGIQSLSLNQMLSLQSLGALCDVLVLLVHPSPPLERRWSDTLPAPSPGVAPRREDPELAEDIDPLVTAWLHGARETQVLLASQQVLPQRATDVPSDPPQTLLQHLQQTVTTTLRPVPQPFDMATDPSVTIHRCHSLSRQAEVLHDALLHAFRDFPDLKPHEVAIVSPCIADAAPHLEAAFDRTITGISEDGAPTHIRLPLVIADRGIREVSESVDLLARLLALVGSRCSVDDVLAVATNPLVRAHIGVGDDDVETWSYLVERTQVRWGLDAGHRGRKGLAKEVPENHTWKLGLERMILGATLPDGPARAELGAAVPLDDVDLADIDSIASLIRIFDVLRTLEGSTADRRCVAEWCDAIEEALTGLCGRECRHLAEPLAEIQRLRQAATAVPVPFRDVQVILTEQFADLAGHQPLRTGAITATSMVPLRGVPFRVICVMGYDDKASRGSEAEGDDLVTRQQLAGDGDPRLDLRRSLLDAMLAAGDRLIVTCIGVSIKNNAPLPLVTPLAEFVDFAVRHGVEREEIAQPSGIEVFHPRHAIGHTNFTTGAVQRGLVWSHDTAALTASAGIGRPKAPAPTRISRRPSRPVIELSLLERMVRDPLKLYLEETLGIDTWREDSEAMPATFPLKMEPRNLRRLSMELLDLLVVDPSAEEAWAQAVTSSGLLPFGEYGRLQLTEIRELARGIRDGAGAKQVPLRGGVAADLRVDVGSARVVGHLTGVHADTEQLVVVTTGKAAHKSYGRPLHIAALHLIAAKARGLGLARATVICRHDKWKPGALTDAGRPVPPFQVRTIALDDSVNAMERLDSLCDLARDALMAPCGLFRNLPTATPAGRKKAFDDFVKGASFSGDVDFYKGSPEFMVYGPAPQFESVFAAGSREVAFLDRFCRLLTPQGRPGSTESRIT